METSRDQTRFSVNFDYRCPFARNANEHMLAALADGAPYDVDFVSFSLVQAHVPDGEPPIWDQPSHRPDLIALAAGIVVRDRLPEQFPRAHVELFAARHDHGGDVRDPAVVRGALERADVDADAVFAELEQDWPFRTLRDEHEGSVAAHAVFGVPTFILGGDAVFVRIMTRPAGDAARATRTIGQVVDLLIGAPDLNEYKHTTIAR